MKDITNYNNKGRLHSYQEYYYKNGLLARFNCKNGSIVGYTESHRSKKTNFYVI